MNTKDTATISTSVNGHVQEKRVEYLGPEIFSLAMLAERWRHANATVESILLKASQDHRLQIHFAWSMKDALGMIISGFMLLDRHELIALAKDISARVSINCGPDLDPSFYQYALTCHNKTPMATRADLVVLAPDVILMEQDYPELKPAYTDHATPSTPWQPLPTVLMGPDDTFVWGYEDIGEIVHCNKDNVPKLAKKEGLPLFWSGANPYSTKYRLASWVENRGGNRRETARNFAKTENPQEN